jgi:hypothetical protein
LSAATSRNISKAPSRGDPGGHFDQGRAPAATAGGGIDGDGQDLGLAGDRPAQDEALLDGRFARLAHHGEDAGRFQQALERLADQGRSKARSCRSARVKQASSPTGRRIMRPAPRRRARADRAAGANGTARAGGGQAGDGDRDRR